MQLLKLYDLLPRLHTRQRTEALRLLIQSRNRVSSCKNMREHGRGTGRSREIKKGKTIEIILNETRKNY